MEKALWFSRHQPSPEQIAGAADWDCEIVAIETGKALGALDCSTDELVKEIVNILHDSAKIQGATAVFGVFPAKLREYQYNLMMCEPEPDRLTCFESSNGSRSVEGGKPTFKSLEWVQTGIL